MQSWIFMGRNSAVIPVPTVTNVQGAGGAVGDIGGAFSVTLTGTNFVIGATTFAVGGTALTSVSVSSTTTATAVMPAKASGSYSVTATTAGGTSVVNGTFEFYSPAQEAMSLWFRAAFASPTAPVASTGTSGSTGNLTAVSGGVTPSFANSLNGRAVATFDGVDDTMNNASIVDNLVGTAAFHVYALFNMTAAAASYPGSAYNEPAFIVDDANGHMNFTFSTRGVTLAHYDLNGTGLWQEANVACATGGWHLVHGWFDGTNLFVQLDSAAPVTGQTVVPPLSTTAAPFAIGRSYNGATFLSGRVAEVAMSKLNLGSTMRSKTKAYINTRYGLTL